MAGCGILILEVLEEIACRGFNSTLMEREERERQREKVERLILFPLLFFHV